MSVITSIFGAAQSASAQTDARAEIEKALGLASGTLTAAVQGANPQIQQSADRAISGVNDATAAAQEGVTKAADTAATGITDAATQANSQLQPYIGAGSDAIVNLTNLFGEGGKYSRDFTAEDAQIDPGYQFRLSEAQKAIQRSAAARGGVLGTAALRQQERYAQGLASEEFSKAFDRFEKQKQDRTSTLMTLGNLGLTAGTRAGANTLGAAESAGRLRTGAAQYVGDAGIGAATYGGNIGIRSTDQQVANNLNLASTISGNLIDVGRARAAEHIGRAEAWNGMLGSIGRTADGFIAGGMGAYGGGGSSGGGGRRGGFRLGDAMRYGLS